MPLRKRADPPISLGTSLEPSTMKVGGLKEELEKRGLETAGKKAELVARLEDAMKAAPGSPSSKKAKPDSTASGSDTVDYLNESVADLKRELESRGMDFSGTRSALLTRLKESKEEAPKCKQRKVDAHCHMPEATVVWDFECVLNQTDIKKNVNKFYIMQILESDWMFHLWTRWGRVGEEGRSSAQEYDDLDEVIMDFEKKFRDKTKNQWDKRDQFVPIPGKYTLIEMDQGDEDMSVALDEPDRGTTALPKVVRPCTLNQPTQDLVKFIFDTDIFNYALKNLYIDTKNMPLGKLSKAQIAKGFEALEAVETAINAYVSKEKLTEVMITSNFYTIIPHDFGRKVPPPIVDRETLQKKFDMLVVLGDIELAQGMQNEAKTERDGQEVPNLLDLQYESLKAELTLLDPSSHEYQVIKKYLEATSGTVCGYNPYSNFQLQHVWKVKREKAAERFKAYDSITNRRLLWHGTNVAAVVAILKSGLRIMPHSGGRIGEGIYFASESGKSTGMVQCSRDGTGIMFLSEVALGKEHWTTHDNGGLVSPPAGFDCVVGRGKTEPDPTCDVTLTIDGRPVKVAQGKPVPTDCLDSNFAQSEYVVYKESQTCIRYMLQMKFSH